jgi:hypothetical protein
MKSWQAWAVILAAAALIPAYYLFFTGNPSPFRASVVASGSNSERTRPTRRPEPTSTQQIGLERVYSRAVDEASEREYQLPEPHVIANDPVLYADKVLIVRNGRERGIYLFYVSDEGNRYRKTIRGLSWDYSLAEQQGNTVWLVSGGLSAPPVRMNCDMDSDGRPDCYHLSIGQFDMSRFSWNDGTLGVFDCPHWETELGAQFVDVSGNEDSVQLTLETECGSVGWASGNLDLPGRGRRALVLEGDLDGRYFVVRSVRRRSAQ